MTPAGLLELASQAVTGLRPIGGVARLHRETTGRFDRLTVLTMLASTNDLFTGLDWLRLVGGSTSGLRTTAWEAGNQRNNELTAFPAGSAVAPRSSHPEAVVIRPHAGITGVCDLDPAVYGWTGAAAPLLIAGP